MAKQTKRSTEPGLAKWLWRKYELPILMLPLLYSFTDTSAPGHFSPKTLRHLYLVPKCPEHFGTGAEMSQDTSGRCGRPTAGESDSDVSMRTHVSRIVSSCFATLRQLRSIRRSTSQAVLVVSLVLSCLDYGNATLTGLPGNQLDRLQSVMMSVLYFDFVKCSWSNLYATYDTLIILV